MNWVGFSKLVGPRPGRIQGVATCAVADEALAMHMVLGGP